MAKKGPTLRDVLEAMNKRFNMVFTELKKHGDHFNFVFRQLTSLREDVKEIRETQKADGEVLDEIRDELSAVSKAVDKDAVTTLDHERRISRLERAR